MLPVIRPRTSSYGTKRTRLRIRRNLARSAGLLMTLIIGSVGRATAASGNSADNQGIIGTRLPVGWELCVLEGVGAPATQDDVTNLDGWQAAEGGSTNNTAAYNPFNTRRITDANGAALPATISSNGFPAFQSWTAGCAATVATLLQPNMTAIVTALRTGDVVPAGQFLSDVDATQWCAPSADDTPCYSSAIRTSNDALAVTSSTDDALQLLSAARSALHSYNQDVATLTAEEATIEAKNLQVEVLQTEVTLSQQQLSLATRMLRRAAVRDYITNRSEDSAVSLQPFDMPTESESLAGLYGHMAISMLAGRVESSHEVFESWVAQRDLLSASIDKMRSSVSSTRATQEQDLSQLNDDLSAIKTAGACTATSISGTSASDPGNGGDIIAVSLTGCLSALATSVGS